MTSAAGRWAWMTKSATRSLGISAARAATLQTAATPGPTTRCSAGARRRRGAVPEARVARRGRAGVAGLGRCCRSERRLRTLRGRVTSDLVTAALPQPAPLRFTPAPRACGKGGVASRARRRWRSYGRSRRRSGSSSHVTSTKKFPNNTNMLSTQGHRSGDGCWARRAACATASWGFPRGRNRHHRRRWRLSLPPTWPRPAPPPSPRRARPRPCRPS
mmetsp:Transcript_22998/g.44688  ORF Transcript_22998/g.44688 Transcript_22998/m.44688 type:complete len:217 (+) Transcript_22998:351-1001(+)